MTLDDGRSADVERLVREHVTRLDTLDPKAPLDDLEPLRAIIGAARVVAIGENNHHVREFYLLRHRIMRFLVERCGFTVYGMESGFTEGLAADAWVHGGPGDVEAVAARHITYTLGETRPMHDHLTWMRSANEAGQASVRFSGVDVPCSAGSPIPALAAVSDFLRIVDPESVPMVDRAIQAAQQYAAVNSAVAVNRYAGLDQPGRDAATAAISRILARLESLRVAYIQRSSPHEYATALHHLKGAWRVDHYLGELDTVMNGTARFAENSSRDAYMAQTVRWLLDHGGPDTRVAVAVHNGHLQRHPLTFADTTMALPMGYHLAHDLGGDYVTLAVTCGAGVTTGLGLDPGNPHGFRLYPVPLTEPEPGSIEAVLVNAEVGLGLVDLRPARRLFHDAPGGPDRIRHADGYIEVPVLDAFDAVFHIPHVQPTEFVPEAGGQATGH